MVAKLFPLDGAVNRLFVKKSCGFVKFIQLKFVDFYWLIIRENEGGKYSKHGDKYSNLEE